MTARTRVKICGITRPEDAAAAARCGADAIGVILVPDTPRYMGHRLPVIREIARAAGPFVQIIAVVRALSDVLRYSGTGFGAVQYYEDDLGRQWSGETRRIRVLRVGDDSACEPDISPDDAVLLDSYDPHRLGGAGRTFDWQAGARLAAAIRLPIIAAGGLNPDNVGAAVRTLRPYGVDVSSGVETAPGIKDGAAIGWFVEAVRKADLSLGDQEVLP